MYVDEPPKDGNIPDFNISKIDICPFRVYQRSFRLFQSDFSKDIHQRSRLLCFTQNDHTGQTGFKICPFLKWALQLSYISFRLQNYTFYHYVYWLWVKKWLHEATKRAQVTDYLLFIFFFVLKNIKIKGAFHLEETPPCTWFIELSHVRKLEKLS